VPAFGRGHGQPSTTIVEETQAHEPAMSAPPQMQTVSGYAHSPLELPGQAELFIGGVLGQPAIEGQKSERSVGRAQLPSMQAKDCRQPLSGSLP
jgi:hypothetical protein